MPELAEVETVKNTLKKSILGNKIVDVNIIYPKIIETDLTMFKTNLINNKITDIKRIGKWLIFEMDKYYLLSHLRMEGKYFIKSSSDKIEKHEHIIISFSNNTDLRYHDTRKFGRMYLVEKQNLYKDTPLKNIGIDLLDNNLTKEYLYNKIHNKNTNIKNLLLDQSIICGLGNIYVNETLFLSKINPTRTGKSISMDECKIIILSARKIINKAIKYGGTTIKSYTSSLGVSGSYQQFLCVHKREGLPCPKCNTLIKNIKINGRSTYYCPNCQK